MVGGVPDSYHLFQDDKAACDFIVENTKLQEVFDWVRLESKLPFDKVILEYDEKAGVPEVIHIQTQSEPRRLAYRGETYGTGTYIQVEVA
jgi:hypothetical protein